jgi:peptide/nickel transport system ATP-binding protein
MSLLEIKNLSCEYVSDKCVVRALDGVSFGLEKGDSLGIVGESGSGKTTIALSIMGLLFDNARVSGSILFKGKDMITMSDHEKDAVRWNEISIVFQNSLEVMNPVMKVGKQVTEPMIKHKGVKIGEAWSRCAELFRMVGLDPEWMESYPHRLSGGMRQKVLLAMALSCEPGLLLLDEVTSAMDWFTKREISELLIGLQKQYDYSMVVISHDIRFVSSIASGLIVLYAGKVVEMGPTRDIINIPRHPYTRGLIHSTPDIFIYKDMWGIPGEAPSGDEYEGCSFYSRCTQHLDICRELSPMLKSCGNGREIACHRGGIASLMQVKGVCYSYTLPNKRSILAVDNVSFDVYEGEVLAIVGQTGSGKSTLAHLLAGVMQSDAGEVHFMGDRVKGGINGKICNRFGSIQIVFQDPFGSTSNRFTVLDAIKEPLDINRIGTPDERICMVKEVMKLVKLPENNIFLAKYCQELSGGQRQRVALARAMIMKPKLLIADEITSALDVSTAANVLRLLKGLQNRWGFAMIYISHDLMLTLKIADRIAVMNAGKIVEIGNAHDVILTPSDEYTKKLVGSRVDLKS